MYFAVNSKISAEQESKRLSALVPGRQQHDGEKKGTIAMQWLPNLYWLLYTTYFTLLTIALKASGWLTAKSARTLRLISIPDL